MIFNANLIFRTAEFRHVDVSPKYVMPLSTTWSKKGKFYASKDKLWTLPVTFLVPKASPLYVIILLPVTGIVVVKFFSFLNPWESIISSFFTKFN